MQSGTKVLQFPVKEPMDKAIRDLYRKRLAFERNARRGCMTDAEELQGDMELTAELFMIAERFGL